MPGPSRRSSTNCTTEYRSSSRFSSGVPERTSANRDFSPLMTRLVFDSQFLIRCPSSSTIRSQAACSIARMSRQHLLVVADGEEAAVVVLGGASAVPPGDELHVALAEAVDFVPPLRFRARRGK